MNEVSKINLLTEALIPLRDARHHRLLKKTNGRSPSFGTVIGYVESGVRGIMLDAVQRPGGWATSESAIVRFIEELTRAKRRPTIQDTPARRRRAAERANKYLESQGL